jgi:hypothetical protein
VRQVVLFALLCLVLVPSNAAAQERKGFWFEFDAGLGRARISAGDFDDSWGWTGGGGFALGWALNPRLLAGFDYRAEAFELKGPLEGDVVLSIVGARVAYYPSPSRGFFVKGTVGGSFVDLSITQSGTTLDANVGKGFGIGAGAGYDWYLGRGISLTPSVTYWHGRTGDFRFLGQTFFTDWSHDVVDMTIGVSFH